MRLGHLGRAKNYQNPAPEPRRDVDLNTNWSRVRSRCRHELEGAEAGWIHRSYDYNPPVSLEPGMATLRCSVAPKEVQIALAGPSAAWAINGTDSILPITRATVPATLRSAVTAKIALRGALNNAARQGWIRF